MTRSGEKSGCAFASNVIDLSAFRFRRSVARPFVVFYISHMGQWLELLSSFHGATVHLVNSLTLFDQKMGLVVPDLVFVESHLSWAEPVEVVGRLYQKFGVPIVMICEEGTRNRQTIKDAYSSGACDTLFSPLQKDEVAETLEVLLKFRRHALRYH